MRSFLMLACGLVAGLVVALLMGAGTTGRLEARVFQAEATAESWRLAAFEQKVVAEALREQVADLERRLEAQWVRPCTVTAYSPRARETDDTPTLTAFMTTVREGTVAVSRDLFAQGWVKGKKVHIWGRGVFEINDLMGETKTVNGEKVPVRNAVDIFRWDTAEALKYAPTTVQVALLD